MSGHSVRLAVVAVFLAIVISPESRVKAASGCSVSVQTGGFPQVVVTGSYSDISPDDWVQLWVDWGDGRSSNVISSASPGNLVLSHSGYPPGYYMGWYQLAGNVGGECVSDAYFDVYVP
jgi:hypothetical protein